MCACMRLQQRYFSVDCYTDERRCHVHWKIRRHRCRPSVVVDAFNDKLTMSDVKRGSASNYATLSFQDLCALPVRKIAEPNALLALWCPSSLLTDGLLVMHEWGFVQKTTFVWVKMAKEQYVAGFASQPAMAFGMGRYFRAAHELCLIGTCGSMMPANRAQRSVIMHPALKHSAKPEELQDSLDLMYPTAQKLEMFARRDRPGWTCTGLECPSMMGADIRWWIAARLNGGTPA
jgi:N6-adenosine-specific RNA methylase IME4